MLEDDEDFPEELFVLPPTDKPEELPPDTVPLLILPLFEEFLFVLLDDFLEEVEDEFEAEPFELPFVDEKLLLEFDDLPQLFEEELPDELLLVFALLLLLEL